MHHVVRRLTHLVFPRRRTWPASVFEHLRPLLKGPSPIQLPPPRSQDTPARPTSPSNPKAGANTPPSALPTTQTCNPWLQLLTLNHSTLGDLISLRQSFILSIVVMDPETAKAKRSLSSFETSLAQLDAAITPVLAALDDIRSKRAADDLDSMTKARLHISLCYTVNSLFCMYLRTQGVDPETHPVMDDITRVQEAFMRMRKVHAGLSADFEPPPNRDRRKHIEKIQTSEAKLSALVFPEERGLVRALQNLKKIEKEEGKDQNEEKPEEDDLEHIRIDEDQLGEMESAAARKDYKAARRQAVREHKEKKRQLKAEKPIKKKNRRRGSKKNKSAKDPSQTQTAT